MAKLAFCGLGQMGAPMSIRLVEAGHDVTVWNRSRKKMDQVVARGAKPAETPAEAATGAEAAITMLATPQAVEDVALGPDGLAEGMVPGSTLIEMSTIGPEAVRGVAARLPARVGVIDAPVLGSIREAERGRLKIFVGGPEEAFRRWDPVLEALGTPRWLGPLGAGAAMKVVVNSTLMVLMTGLGEALALGDALGLDRKDMLDVLSESQIGVTARSKRGRIESGSYPPNFRMALARKDSVLVTEAGARTGLDLPLARAARSWMEAADDAGLGDLDYSAVIAHILGDHP